MQLGAPEDQSAIRMTAIPRLGSDARAIGLGSEAGRSKARNPASDPPKGGCREMRLTSGASQSSKRTKLWRRA
eukprot:12667516-Alexandrium_andersonii.AAC.1